MQTGSEERWKVVNLGLFLTENCNLRCKYCFVPKKPKKAAIEDIRKTLRYFINRGLKSIYFFGGEPLLEFNLIKKIIEEFREKLKFSITTNGTLMKGGTLDFWVKNKLGVLFSIDGKEKTHNTNRIYFNGKGSFQECIQGARTLIKNNYKLTARSTFTPETVLFLNENIVWLIEEEKFNAVAPTPDLENSIWDKSSLRIYEEQYEKIIQWVAKRIIQGQPNPVVYLEKSLRNVVNGRKEPAPCGTGKGLLAMGTDGEIYPCHQFCLSPEFSIGKVPNLKFEKFKFFRNYKMPKKCQQCFTTRCAGGCLALNYRSTGNLMRQIPAVCRFNRIEFDMTIKLLQILEGNPSFEKAYIYSKKSLLSS